MEVEQRRSRLLSQTWTASLCPIRSGRFRVGFALLCLLACNLPEWCEDAVTKAVRAVCAFGRLS